jgi:prepilin-type N-terminal cleavage/methylation domain-containing protein
MTVKPRSGNFVAIGLTRLSILHMFKFQQENDVAGMPPPSLARCGFTLVELLIVVALIGMLAALLPAVQAARESSRKATCTNNMRQMGLAATLFAGSRGTYPCSWPKGDASITWPRELLPHLDRSWLDDAWDDDLGFFEGANGDLAATVVPTYKCPTAPSEDVYEYEKIGPQPTRMATIDYKGCQGANSNDPLVKHWGRTGWAAGIVSREYTRPAKITDGLSQTILLVESVGGWTSTMLMAHPGSSRVYGIPRMGRGWAAR